MRFDKQQISRAYLDREHGYFNEGDSPDALIAKYPTRYSGDDAWLSAYSDVIRLHMLQHGESAEEIERKMDALWKRSNSYKRAHDRMKARG